MVYLYFINFGHLFFYNRCILVLFKIITKVTPTFNHWNLFQPLSFAFVSTSVEVICRKTYQLVQWFLWHIYFVKEKDLMNVCNRYTHKMVTQILHRKFTTQLRHGELTESIWRRIKNNVIHIKKNINCVIVAIINKQIIIWDTVRETQCSYKIKKRSWQARGACLSPQSDFLNKHT